MELITLLASFLPFPNELDLDSSRTSSAASCRLAHNGAKRKLPQSSVAGYSMPHPCLKTSIFLEMKSLFFVSLLMQRPRAKSVLKLQLHLNPNLLCMYLLEFVCPLCCSSSSSISAAVQTSGAGKSNLNRGLTGSDGGQTRKEDRGRRGNCARFSRNTEDCMIAAWWRSRGEKSGGVLGTTT